MPSWNLGMGWGWDQSPPTESQGRVWQTDNPYAGPTPMWSGSSADNATPRSGGQSWADQPTQIGEAWSATAPGPSNPFENWGYSYAMPSYRERTGGEIQQRMMFPGPSQNYWNRTQGQLANQGMFEANISNIAPGLTAEGMQRQVANRAMGEYDKYMQPMDQAALDASYQRMLDKTGAAMTQGAAARGMLGSSVAEQARSESMADLAAQRAVWNEQMALQRANTARGFLGDVSGIMGQADEFKRQGFRDEADLLRQGQEARNARLDLGGSLAGLAQQGVLGQGALALNAATAADRGGMDRTESAFDMEMRSADALAQQQRAQFEALTNVFNLLGGNLEHYTDAGTANVANNQAQDQEQAQAWAEAMKALGLI